MKLIQEIVEEDEISNKILQESRDYQRQSCNIKRHPARLKRLLDGGQQSPGTPFTQKRPQNRSKSAAPGYATGSPLQEEYEEKILQKRHENFEQHTNFVDEISSAGGGAISGFTGERKNKLIEETNDFNYHIETNKLP
jgi:hypothetical protein